MSAPLQTLCQFLEDALTRQEQVRTAVKAQREAIIAQDTETLEARTADLTAVLEAIAAAEAERAARFGALCRELGAAGDSVSALIAVAPEPWKTRIAGLQRDIQASLNEARDIVRENNRLLRRALRRRDVCLQSITSRAGQAAPPQYTALGREHRTAGIAPAMLDSRG